MTTPQAPNSYRELVRQVHPPSAKPARKPEEELDSLITLLKERQQRAADQNAGLDPDQIQTLRELTINELVPIFVELMEKYSKSGISMHMDASNFLEGGREIKFEFGLGQHRAQLHGTVTTEAIAFHETRQTPDVHGELVSGPMVRLRALNGEKFRNFICERLAQLLRTAVRRH
ncbi:MAG: hypothetical protein JSU86_16180 [Phycisphaerales bacterium]|nr:MAG: hypothetical protein JSU86_16180 [Phycisphaerales bacterium]